MPKKTEKDKKTGSQRESSSSGEEREGSSRRDSERRGRGESVSRTRGESVSEHSSVSEAARKRGISAAASAVAETGAAISEFARSGLRRFQRSGATAEERRRARISLIGEVAGVYTREAQQFAEGLAAAPSETIQTRRNWLIIEALANAIEEQGLDLDQVRGMVGPLRGMIQSEMDARHVAELQRAGVTRGRQERGESVVSQLPEALRGIQEAADDVENGATRHVLGLLASRMAQRVRAMAPATRPTMPTMKSMSEGASALKDRAKAALRGASSKVEEDVGEIGKPTDVRRVGTAEQFGGNPLGQLQRRSEVPGGGTHKGTIAHGAKTKDEEARERIQGAKAALKPASRDRSSSSEGDQSLKLSGAQQASARKVSFAAPATTARPAPVPPPPPRRPSVGSQVTPPATPASRVPPQPPSRQLPGAKQAFLGDIAKGGTGLRKTSVVNDRSAPQVTRSAPTAPPAAMGGETRQRSGTVARQIQQTQANNPELAAKLARRNQESTFTDPRAGRPPIVTQQTAAQQRAAQLGGGATGETIEQRLARQKAEREAQQAAKPKTAKELFEEQQRNKKGGPGAGGGKRG